MTYDPKNVEFSDHFAFGLCKPHVKKLGGFSEGKIGRSLGCRLMLVIALAGHTPDTASYS
jgi:hypothetical protein